MKCAEELNKFWIEDPYSSNPKVYQYPVDGIDDGALVVVEYSALEKVNAELAEAVKTINEMQNATKGFLNRTEIFNLGSKFNAKYPHLFNKYLESIK